MQAPAWTRAYAHGILQENNSNNWAISGQRGGQVSAEPLSMILRLFTAINGRVLWAFCKGLGFFPTQREMLTSSKGRFPKKRNQWLIWCVLALTWVEWLNLFCICYWIKCGNGCIQCVECCKCMQIIWFTGMYTIHSLNHNQKLLVTPKEYLKELH